MRHLWLKVRKAADVFGGGGLKLVSGSGKRAQNPLSRVAFQSQANIDPY